MTAVPYRVLLAAHGGSATVVAWPE